MTYLLPTTLTAALSALAEGSGESPVRLVAGATDYFPGLGIEPATGSILDISRLDALRGLELVDEHWRIGALTTWTDIATADLPAAFTGLQQAATQVGGVQIQNVGTVVGNICNASPAADGVPPLLALDALVELRSVEQTRVVALSDFILGNRSTTCQPDELVVAILIPDIADEPDEETRTCSSFVKLGSRSYLVISIVMVAVVVTTDQSGIIRSARVCVGACSEVAQRLNELEADLIGKNIEQLENDIVTEKHLAPLSPIDDIRATASYRLQVTPNLIIRALRDSQEVAA